MFDINKAKETIEKAVLMWRYLYGCAVYSDTGISEKDLDTALSPSLIDLHRKIIKQMILSLTKDEQVSLIKIFINNEPISTKFLERIVPLQEECVKYNDILLGGNIIELQKLFETPEQLYAHMDNITDSLFEEVMSFMYDSTINIEAEILKKIILSLLKLKITMQDIYGIKKPKS